MLMADTPRTVSLRAGLLLRLGIVLVLLLALDAVASYFTALHFANLVYDRWLIDSTRSLAQAVRAEHRGEADREVVEPVEREDRPQAQERALEDFDPHVVAGRPRALHEDL